MSDATTAAPAASPAPEPAAAPAAAPAPAAAAPAAAAPAPSAAPAAAPATTPAASPAPTAAPAAAPKPDASTGAPEAYEFKAPEGAELNPATVGEFSALAKELNLPQDAAQKVVDFGVKVQQDTLAQVQTHMAEQAEKQAEEWGNQSKADKEFGGDKFDENLAVAKKALDQFGTPELKTLLVQSKMGNHPEVLRTFVRIGQAISQDGFVPGRAGASTTDARGIFANSKMNP